MHKENTSAINDNVTQATACVSSNTNSEFPSAVNEGAPAISTGAESPATPPIAETPIAYRHPSGIIPGLIGGPPAPTPLISAPTALDSARDTVPPVEPSATALPDTVIPTAVAIPSAVTDGQGCVVTTPGTVTAVPAAPPATVIPITRPGISNGTLVRMGVRHANADEALALTGLARAGILIPYPGVVDGGKPFYRLRCDVPAPTKSGAKKYHQQSKSKVHLYIPIAYTLYRGQIVIIEGEFKSLALSEQGVPAIGSSGFYGAFAKDANGNPVVNPELEALIARLMPESIVFFGDSDTALNYQFSHAMVRLADLTGLTVYLPRTQYHAPYGKGADDIRETLGPVAFEVWLQDALKNAVKVQPGTKVSDLAMTLLNLEIPNLSLLPPAAHTKPKEQLAKLAVFMPHIHYNVIAGVAHSIFGLKTSDFAKAVKEYATEHGVSKKKPTRTAPSTPPTTLAIVDDYIMVGKDFYGPSYDAAGKRSKLLSMCNYDTVRAALIMQGFDPATPNDVSFPGYGVISGMSRLDAAFAYLGFRRCAMIVKHWYERFGRIAIDGGLTHFNNYHIEIPTPQGNVMSWDAPEVAFTGAYLKALLGHEQLEHFTCLISKSYLNARNYEYSKLLALFFLGEQDAGKSLLIDHFLPRLHGQREAADVERLFLNEIGASAALDWYVCKLSDKDLGDALRVKRVQSGMLQLLADHTTVGRRLYQDVDVQKVYNLFALSSNTTGSVMNLLKDIPTTLSSKLAVYSCGRGLLDLVGAFPAETLQHPANRIEAELPFVCSLLENWQKSAAAAKWNGTRFGVKPYWSRDIEKSLTDTEEERLVAEVIAASPNLTLTGSALYTTLVDDFGHASTLRNFRCQRFTEILRALSDRRKDLVEMKEYLIDGKVHNRVFNINPKKPASPPVSAP